MSFLYTDPEYRGRHLSGLIAVALGQTAYDQGFRQHYLMCSASNKEVRKAAERLASPLEGWMCYGHYSPTL